MAANNIKAPACPLLAAVLPLRYALGPSLPLDTSPFKLPPLQGRFPELGELSETVAGRDMRYVARLLRDGWLYVWQSTPAKLIEFRVQKSLLQETARGGKIIDNQAKAFVMLPAGVEAMMAWSPVQWNDSQFSAAKGQSKTRNRVMRAFIPGAKPVSGKAESIHEYIGDYMEPIGFRWSVAPDTRKRPDWVRTLDGMKRCEQNAYAIVDDPWGVLLDLAALIRHRQSTFDAYRKQRSDDWAMAGVLKTLSESDAQIRGQLPSITRYDALSKTWQEQAQKESAYADDLRVLSVLWVRWYETMAEKGPASLDTACGHFDISLPDSRAGLEMTLAAACLGPATTSLGAKRLSQTLNLEDQQGSPWLLWALMGLAKRLNVPEIKSLVDLADGANDNAGGLAKAGAQMGRALALSMLINKAAANLSRQAPAEGLEALALALSPVAGLHLHGVRDKVCIAVKVYISAALARTHQRLNVGGASQRQVGEWLSDQMGTRLTPPAKLKLTPLAAGIKEAFPFFYLAPAKSAAGTSSILPNIAELAPETNLRGLLNLSKDALDSAPIKVLVGLVAAVNFGWGVKEMASSPSAKNLVSSFGGAFGIAAATSAVWQKVAETNWEAIATPSGAQSTSARVALAEALGIGARTAGLQAIVAGFDIVTYGLETLESYRSGDFDTAAINAGLSAASSANLAIYVKTYRVVRAARAAVIAGEAATIGRGVAQAPHLAFKALGVTILIVGGVIARLYTQDTPLEKWVKGTRFGTSPADWADNYSQTMVEFYKVVFPITLDAYRLNELNPYTGMVETTYVMLRMPGKTTLTDEMISFKGEETWGGFFGYGSKRVNVSWTGKDFDAHRGTRIATDQGVLTYRRVYHQDTEGRKLNKISGTLLYSPLEGMTLPAVEIKDIAWL
ncbi:toxin VasX [Pseudomonas sp. SO81]|uniref:toxin VasX n=1 Tax=Pseudomonas sp. SO81 TaxID=2983246 RepID=UPI0025A4BCBF|nr:toxin VasX [Pseudomonas sp. SO81]WJN59032.1 hypothetical protein OH686_09825 [Pseudomonas sp. SO81]